MHVTVKDGSRSVVFTEVEYEIVRAAMDRLIEDCHYSIAETPVALIENADRILSEAAYYLAMDDAEMKPEIQF